MRGSLDLDGLSMVAAAASGSYSTSMSSSLEGRLLVDGRDAATGRRRSAPCRRTAVLVLTDGQDAVRYLQILARDNAWTPGSARLRPSMRLMRRAGRARAGFAVEHRGG
jgi:hypothetical protein